MSGKSQGILKLMISSNPLYCLFPWCRHILDTFGRMSPNQHSCHFFISFVWGFLDQRSGVYEVLFMAKIDYHQTLSVISILYKLLHNEILDYKVMPFRQYI